MADTHKDHAQTFFNGVINVMNDIRHKVVEEPWFGWGNGRTVTGDIPERNNSPQAHHAATLTTEQENSEPDRDWRSRLNDSDDVYGHDQALTPQHHTESPEYDWRERVRDTDDVYGHDQTQEPEHEIER